MRLEDMQQRFATTLATRLRQEIERIDPAGCVDQFPSTVVPEDILVRVFVHKAQQPKMGFVRVKREGGPEGLVVVGLCGSQTTLDADDNGAEKAVRLLVPGLDA